MLKCFQAVVVGKAFIQLNGQRRQLPSHEIDKLVELLVSQYCKCPCGVDRFIFGPTEHIVGNEATISGRATSSPDFLVDTDPHDQQIEVNERRGCRRRQNSCEKMKGSFMHRFEIEPINPCAIVSYVFHAKATNISCRRT